MTPALGRTGSVRLNAATLTAIAAASLVLWQLPFGNLALFPFTILTTWFHEMGHGLATIAVGSSFDHLVIFADGSGYAVSTRPIDAGRLTTALIAAAGPMGPAIVGSLLIVASGRDAHARQALYVLGAALVLSTVIWVRSAIGWLVLPGLGLLTLLVAARGPHGLVRFVVQLVGVQACISAWRSFDYLFSDGGTVGGTSQRSDTAAIADVLLLPYWFWGAAISAGIVASMWWSLSRSFGRRSA
jgi:hypothetical protein